MYHQQCTRAGTQKHKISNEHTDQPRQKYPNKNRNKKLNNRRKAYRQSILGRTGRHRTNDTYKRALRSRRNDQFFLARVGLLSVHEKDVPTRMEASTPESSLIGRRCPPIGILMGRLTPRLTIPQRFIMDMSHFLLLCGRVNVNFVRKFWICEKKNCKIQIFYDNYDGKWIKCGSEVGNLLGMLMF